MVIHPDAERPPLGGRPNRNWPLLLALTWIIAGGDPASAGTIRVPADQPTIQAAVDAAATGDEVLVATGTYTGPGNKNVRIEGKDIAVRSEGGPEVTIIDCEGSGRGFFIAGVNSPLGLVEGFTVQNGDADGGDPVGGGGMFVGGSSLIIRNCILRSNSAHGANFNGGGGGISCYGGAPIIEDCRFERNAAVGTGAVGGGLGGHQSSVVVRRCSFVENRAIGSVTDGGGLGVSVCDAVIEPPVIEGCVFNSNTAPLSGGAFVCGGKVTGCSFVDNVAEGSSGGLAALYCSVRDCIFTGNVASGGGGLATTDSEISGCVLTRNRAGSGAGISIHGAATIEECIIADNAAVNWGGGISCGSREPVVIRNCTIARNSAQEASGIGVFSVTPVTHQLDNVIIATGQGGSAVACAGLALATMTCSDIYGNEGGDWVGCISEQFGTDGNISADPRFCDPKADDWQLCEESKCAPAQSGDSG